MTGSGKGQVTWPWEVDQAFRLEAASGLGSVCVQKTSAAVMEVTGYQTVCGAGSG